MQLTDGPVLRFENFVKMAERVALWVKLTGAKVHSVETTRIPMYPCAMLNRFSSTRFFLRLHVPPPGRLGKYIKAQSPSTSPLTGGGVVQHSWGVTSMGGAGGTVL